MNPTLAPKLSPWLFVFLALTQCARTETVDARPAGSSERAAPTAAPDDTAESAVRVPVDGLPAFGDPRAPVTVVAFTDYECPYCAKADASLDVLREEYGDKLRIVVAMQPLPFHEHAADAARAFLAAVELGKGEAMHRKLFAMQRANLVMTDANLEAAAREIGLLPDVWNRVRRSDSVSALLERSQSLAGRLGVRGTPTFFTNGRRLVGARPLETFRALLDEELVKATKLDVRDPYGAIMKSAPEPRPVEAPTPETLQHFDVDLAKAPIRGEANGPITVVFFSDFECPYCVRAEKTLRDLEAKKPGQVKIAYKFRPLPMHAHARDAAKAAIAAERQGRFWAYHDVLLERRDALAREDLLRYAAEVGLDLGRFERDMDDPRTEERIQADETQATALGARGTPTAFVNGYRIVGAQPLPTWLDAASLPRAR